MWLERSSWLAFWVIHRQLVLPNDKRWFHNVDTHLTIPNTNVLKTRGVKINVVAVGSYVDEMDEEVKIASFPPQNQLLRLKVFAGFWNLTSWLWSRLLWVNISSTMTRRTNRVEVMDINKTTRVAWDCIGKFIIWRGNSALIARENRYRANREAISAISVFKCNLTQNSRVS